MLRAILNINPLILATSLALLAVALGLLVRRRMTLVQLQRRRRLAEQAASEGGETSVLPLAHLASAVEVLDLDDLLAGEEGSIAAAARVQLEQLTDVGTAPDTFFPLPATPAGRAGMAFAPMAASAAPPRPGGGAANPVHAGGEPLANRAATPSSLAASIMSVAMSRHDPVPSSSVRAGFWTPLSTRR